MAQSFLPTVHAIVCYLGNLCLFRGIKILQYLLEVSFHISHSYYNATGIIIWQYEIGVIFSFLYGYLINTTPFILYLLKCHFGRVPRVNVCVNLFLDCILFHWSVHLFCLNYLSFISAPMC
jgi:hypothetical protein